MTREQAYRILELEDGSTQDEIRKAFRVLALKVHPDHGGTAAMFLRIKEAQDFLLPIAPKKRFVVSKDAIKLYRIISNTVETIQLPPEAFEDRECVLHVFDEKMGKEFRLSLTALKKPTTIEFNGYRLRLSTF